MKPVEPFMAASVDQFCSLPQGDICYRTFGPAKGEPVVLIGGLAVQLIYWPDALIHRLTKAGHRVIVPDNRDIGRSFRYKGGIPRLKNHIFRKPVPGYSLSDMAGDIVGLLDHLGHSQAHVAGMSMGGMIAQTIAAEHAPRVKSLTSIFSTTGNPKVGQPSLQGKMRMLKKRPMTKEENTERYIDLIRFIADERFRPADEVSRAYAELAWDRGNGLKAGAGIARQINAIYASGNREAALRNIKAPTLVIHGDRDPLVHPSGGVATAKAIEGSSLVVINGMGHHISDEVSPLLADLLLGHMDRSVA